MLPFLHIDALAARNAVLPAVFLARRHPQNFGNLIASQ
jgi:hypothetical protein